MSFEDTKQEVAIANRVLAASGLASGLLASNGHASMRVPEDHDRFIVKGRGYEMDALERMRPEDMIVCDLDGFKVEGPDRATQCFEVKMHSSIYKMYPDVQAVVHVHPRFTVLMSVLGTTLVPMCQEGIALVSEPLPIYPHVKTVVTEEEGNDVAVLLGSSKAILLLGHGATTTGRSLEEAVMNMLYLEEQARMNWYACCAAGPGYTGIAPELIAELSGRTPMRELDHFKVPMADAQPVVAGVWRLYRDIVSKDL